MSTFSTIDCPLAHSRVGVTRHKPVLTRTDNKLPTKRTLTIRQTSFSRDLPSHVLNMLHVNFAVKYELVTPVCLFHMGGKFVLSDSHSLDIHVNHVRYLTVYCYEHPGGLLLDQLANLYSALLRYLVPLL